MSTSGHIVPTVLTNGSTASPQRPLRRRRSSHTTRQLRSQRKMYGAILAGSSLAVLLVWLALSWVIGTEARRSARRKRSLHGFSEARMADIPENIQSPSSLSNLLQHPLLTAYPTPTCPVKKVHEERYAPLKPSYGSGRHRKRSRSTPFGPHDQPRHQLKYFIAANFYSSSNVLPSIIKAVQSLVTSLDPSRFHVSIYENESDDQTPAQLFLFSKILEKLGVGFTIVSSTNRSDRRPGHRIQGLADLRNYALKPLFDSPKGTFDRVIFLNDVHFCEVDLMEILLQHEVQGADMSCGMDYKELRIKEFEKSGYPLLFYDMWVARTMEGLPFYRIKFPTGDWELPSSPMPHSASRGLLHSLRPLQVYSCFNGVSVIDAALFYPPHSLRFHSKNGTDEESECFLFCRDLWGVYSPVGIPGRKKGRGAKIQVVPRASVGYELVEYQKARKDQNTTAYDVPGLHDAHELIKWKLWPPKQVASYPFGHWDEEVWIPPFDIPH